MFTCHNLRITLKSIWTIMQPARNPRKNPIMPIRPFQLSIVRRCFRFQLKLHTHTRVVDLWKIDFHSTLEALPTTQISCTLAASRNTCFSFEIHFPFRWLVLGNFNQIDSAEPANRTANLGATLSAHLMFCWKPMIDILRTAREIIEFVRSWQNQSFPGGRLLGFLLILLKVWNRLEICSNGFETFFFFFKLFLLAAFDHHWRI